MNNNLFRLNNNLFRFNSTLFRLNNNLFRLNYNLFRLNNNLFRYNNLFQLIIIHSGWIIIIIIIYSVWIVSYQTDRQNSPSTYCLRCCSVVWWLPQLSVQNCCAVVNKWMSQHSVRCIDSDNNRNPRLNKYNSTVLPKFLSLLPENKSIFRSVTKLGPISPWHLLNCVECPACSNRLDQKTHNPEIWAGVDISEPTRNASPHRWVE